MSKITVAWASILYIHWETFDYSRETKAWLHDLKRSFARRVFTTRVTFRDSFYTRTLQDINRSVNRKFRSLKLCWCAFKYNIEYSNEIKWKIDGTMFQSNGMFISEWIYFEEIKFTHSPKAGGNLSAVKFCVKPKRETKRCQRWAWYTMCTS